MVHWFQESFPDGCLGDEVLTGDLSLGLIYVSADVQGCSSSSSSSSSPLLSLVQVPAKLAINLSIHTQHTYDNGVDRTGRQGIKKNTAFT